jgi:TonB-dependent starch-binding outer membrane protein SusC
MNSYQFATYRKELDLDYGRQPLWSDEDIEKFRAGTHPLTHPDTDWRALTYREYAPESQHTISATGGTESVSYYLSGQILNREAMYKSGDMYFKRYQIRSNIDAQVTNSLKVGLNLLGRLRNEHRPGFQPWYEIHQAFPTDVGEYPNGLPGVGLIGVAHGVLTSDKAGWNDYQNTSLLSQLSFDLNLNRITPGLRFMGYGSYDFDLNQTEAFRNPYMVYQYIEATDSYREQVGYQTIRSLSLARDTRQETFVNLRLNYENTFGHHNVNTFVAYEHQEGYSQDLSGYRRDLISETMVELYTGSTVGQSATGSSNEWGRVNYFGYLGYDYQRKYLIDFTLRRDGSFNFPEAGRWGLFPGVSVGWTISQEPFMAFTNNWLSNLKLRASWAQLGNDRVGSFQFLTKYGLSNYAIFGEGGGERYETFAQSNVPNPFITWETSENQNIGFDASLFDHTLVVNLDLFHEKRRDILITRSASMPAFTALSLPSENLGKVDNRGYELQLAYRNNFGSLNYSIGGNIQQSRNKVIYLDEAADVPDYRKQEGFPIDSWVLYPTDGLFRAQEEIDNAEVIIPGQRPGDIRHLDLNEDGQITADDRYRRHTSRIPEIQYGLNVGLSYKGLSLRGNFVGAARVEVPIVYTNPIQRLNLPEYRFHQRWTPETAQTANYPRAHPGPRNSNYWMSDFWLINGSFFGLNSASLSYTLPQRWVSRVNLSNLTFYLTGTNLGYIYDAVSQHTGQKDYHPELGARGHGSHPENYYPQTTTIRFGVRLEL